MISDVARFLQTWENHIVRANLSLPALILIPLVVVLVLLDSKVFAGPDLARGRSETVTTPQVQNEPPLEPLNEIQILAKGYKNLSHTYTDTTPEHVFPITSMFIDATHLFLQYDNQFYFVTLQTTNVPDVLDPSFTLITEHLQNNVEHIRRIGKPYQWYPDLRVMIYTTQDQALYAYLIDTNQHFRLIEQLIDSNKAMALLPDINKIIYLSDENTLYAFDLINKTTQQLYTLVLDYQYIEEDQKLFVLRRGNHTHSFVGSLYIVDMRYPEIHPTDTPLWDEISSFGYIPEEGKLWVLKYVDPLRGNLYVADIQTYPELTFQLYLSEVAHAFDATRPDDRPYYQPYIRYIPKFHAVTALIYRQHWARSVTPIPSSYSIYHPARDIEQDIHRLKYLYLVDLNGRYVEKVARDVIDVQYFPREDSLVYLYRRSSEPLYPERRDAATHIKFNKRSEGDDWHDIRIYGPIGSYMLDPESGLSVYLKLDSANDVLMRVVDVGKQRILFDRKGIIVDTNDLLTYGFHLQTEYYPQTGIKRLMYAVGQRYALQHQLITYQRMEFPINPPFGTRYLPVLIPEFVVPEKRDSSHIPDMPVPGDVPHTTTPLMESPSIAAYQRHANNLIRFIHTGTSDMSYRELMEPYEAPPFLQYDEKFAHFPIYINTLIFPDGTILRFPCEHLNVSPQFKTMLIVKRGYYASGNDYLPKDMVSFFSVQLPTHPVP